ncbi:unnamed protein product [Meganyctiphanes norvegica]|uniref:Uncharacterized protein n=1 Tax=Meganyctiphanes norvegica TaxID=48144 RepID=A0AAV2RWC9_MEGNR
MTTSTTTTLAVMSGKRKPRTPSPSPEVGKDEPDSEAEDLYAGRRVSVSEFDGQDFGYESVSSPGASSTSSEPAYIRKPGFDHHAHEFRAATTQATTTPSQSQHPHVSPPHQGLRSPIQSPLSPTDSISSKGSKKKKSSVHEIKHEPGKSISSFSTSRARGKKEPLPMKLRALPQSFWLQPNKNNNLPPSCSTLPPLILGKDASEVIDVRPVTPPPSSGDDGECTSTGTSPSRLETKEEGGFTIRSHGERFIKVGNTDLLFSLFDAVEQPDKKKIAVVRRGRPRKPPSTVLPRVLRDEDPCLVSAVTESILPLLPDRTPANSGSSTPLGTRGPGQQLQVLQMVNLQDGDRTISLPSLNVEHNYNQILSELVMKL